MLITVAQIAFYALLTGVGSYHGFKLLDTLLDYKMYFGNVRYSLAKRAAAKVGLSEYLGKATIKADSLPVGEQVAFMDTVYWEIAAKNNAFKRWICLTCFVIYGSLWVILFGSGLLIYTGFGFWSILYFMGSYSVISFMLNE